MDCESLRIMALGPRRLHCPCHLLSDVGASSGESSDMRCCGVWASVITKRCDEVWPTLPHKYNYLTLKGEGEWCLTSIKSDIVKVRLRTEWFLESPHLNDINISLAVTALECAVSLRLYLEAADEVVSCEQLVEYEFKCVIPAGLI